MVVTEIYINESDGKEFKKTYSDKGFLIKKIGTDEFYDEAIDLPNATFEYEETTELINEEDAAEEDYLQALEELGVSE